MIDFPQQSVIINLITYQQCCEKSYSFRWNGSVNFYDYTKIISIPFEEIETEEW